MHELVYSLEKHLDKRALSNKLSNLTLMKKILIVEDDKNILRALETYFVRKKYIVKTADNADDVLEIVDHYVPDLLITDWKLGSNIDGADLALIISNKNKDLAVIFITGHKVEKLREKLKNVTAHKIIKKPFEFSEINDSVNSALA